MTEKHVRVSWDEYFLGIAMDVATRATCPRKRVGAVIVSPYRHIISTGYNGSTPGADHCDDIGCMMENDHCIRTVHAEVNAIAQAASNGVSVRGASSYTTASPCWPCFQLLVNSGVRRMAFGEFYRRDERIFEAAEKAGVEIVDLREIMKARITAAEEGPRSRAIKEVAKWISSSMASAIFGSSSWGLRKSLADTIEGRDWERHLKNEEMRP